jgi:hypothetical protein
MRSFTGKHDMTRKFDNLPHTLAEREPAGVPFFSNSFGKDLEKFGLGS